MISQKCQYALRALFELSRRYGDGPVRIADIAEAQDIPPRFLEVILSQLKLILLLTIIGGMQGFEGLFILTRGGPGFKTTVPGLWMYFNAFSFQRMGYACAIGVCLFALIFGLPVSAAVSSK